MKKFMEVEKKQEGNSAVKKAIFLGFEKRKKNKENKRDRETVDTHTDPAPLHKEEKEFEETLKKYN